MKNIRTRSILEKKSPNDGIRICVMRRIRKEYDFDLWLPVLAPPQRLLQEYVIDKTIGWDEFALRFRKTVLTKRKAQLTLRLLRDLSQKAPLTLLCGEKSPRYCHRSLIIQEIASLSQKLVNIKRRKTNRP